jgi:hypothetical protein
VPDSQPSPLALAFTTRSRSSLIRNGLMTKSTAPLFKDSLAVSTGQIPQAQLASHATDRRITGLRQVAADVPGVKRLVLGSLPSS